uniref:Uncharacterized protein n=1 Tax=Anopheles merus TaxID=30066 RepID=A0A182VHJ2_ANOME
MKTVQKKDHANHKTATCPSNDATTTLRLCWLNVERLLVDGMSNQRSLVDGTTGSRNVGSFLLHLSVHSRDSLDVVGVTVRIGSRCSSVSNWSRDNRAMGSVRDRSSGIGGDWGGIGSDRGNAGVAGVGNGRSNAGVAGVRDGRGSVSGDVLGRNVLLDHSRGWDAVHRRDGVVVVGLSAGDQSDHDYSCDALWQ